MIAMVSMRYAENLAMVLGWSGTRGGPPVEGYTNFLWTLYMAFLHVLPIPESKISLAVAVTGIIVLVLNIFVVKKITEYMGGNKIFSFLLHASLRASTIHIVYWTLRGMEVGLLTLTMNLSIYYAMKLVERFEHRYNILISAFLILSLLIRPDAIVFYIIISLFVIYKINPVHRLSFCTAMLFPIIAVVIQTLLRYHYYGDIFPNTYYLKITGIPLLERVHRGMKMFLALLYYHSWPIFLLIIINALSSLRLYDFKRTLLLAIVCGQCLYSIYVGVMPGNGCRCPTDIYALRCRLSSYSFPLPCRRSLHD